jgi:hypothetical protein
MTATHERAAPPTAGLTGAGLEHLDRRDRAAIEGLAGVARVHVNPARWWQNASFALPLLLGLLSLLVGLAVGLAEAAGFGLFLLAVTAVMLPVVLLTWRGTATAVVLTEQGAQALHRGRVLHALDWAELRRIERVEYLGNTRHKLVHGEDEQFLTVESELADPAGLVEAAFALSGLPRQSEGQSEARPDA